MQFHVLCAASHTKEMVLLNIEAFKKLTGLLLVVCFLYAMLNWLFSRLKVCARLRKGLEVRIVNQQWQTTRCSKHGSREELESRTPDTL
jgi:transposase